MRCLPVQNNVKPNPYYCTELSLPPSSRLLNYRINIYLINNPLWCFYDFFDKIFLHSVLSLCKWVRSWLSSTKDLHRKSIRNLGLCGYRFKRIVIIIWAKLFDVNYLPARNFPFSWDENISRQNVLLHTFLEILSHIINWLMMHLPFLKPFLIFKSNKHSIFFLSSN